MSTRIVTFDVGQTLVELDLDFLAARVATRGIVVEAASLRHAAGPAWERYDARTAAGDQGQAVWHELMTMLLTGAGVGGDVSGTVAWLWAQQPTCNLWRHPIPDMVALARELAADGVRVGVVSNSEGRIAELLAEIGIADPFAAVIDSGRLGIEKPDPRIFAAALAALGVTDGNAVHIGDAWAADIAGALAAGWRAIWYGRRAVPTNDPRVAVAHDAAGVRAALARFAI